MIRFKEYLLQEQVVPKKKKEGIPEIPPHATDREGKNMNNPYILNHDDLADFMKGGKVDISKITEKTDGRPHFIDVDGHGRVSIRNSSTGNKSLYSHEEIENELRARAAKKGVQYEGSNYERNAELLKDLHSRISGNKALVKHLQQHAQRTGESSILSGEIYDARDAATNKNYDPANPATHHLKDLKDNEVVPTVTPYSRDRLHHSGLTFVVHSQMNPEFDTEKLKSLADDKMGIDDDKIQADTNSVDVKDEAKDLHKLVNTRVGDDEELRHPEKDHPNNRMTVDALLKTRDKDLDEHGLAAKQKAHARFLAIGQRVKDKVEQALHKNLNTSKWNSNPGRSPEAVVIHPNSPDKPRVKLLSKKFAQDKGIAGTAWAVHASATVQEVKKAVKK